MVSNPSRAGTAGELGNAVSSEYIDAMLSLAVNTPFTYDMVARRKDLTGLNSLTWTIPIYSKLAVAASVADGAEPAPVALANTQAQVTAAMYMQHVFLGYQSQGLIVTEGGEFRVALDRVVDAVRTKLDTDVLGLTASITATQGSAATENTFDNLISAISAFRASAKNAQGAILMHADAMRDLIADLAGVIVAGTERGAGAVASLTDGQMGPKMINVVGLPAIESDRIPVGDTTGWTNAIVEVGANAPLGLAFRRNANLDGVAMLGDGGVPVHVEILKSDTSPGHYVRAFCHHGVGIIDQARAINFITRT